MKNLSALPIFAALIFLTGCQTGFDRSMDYKDKALEARRDSAIISLGGSIVETTETAPDGSVTCTKTTSVAEDSQKTDSPHAGITMEPGARVDFGFYVRNTGAVPLTVDPSKFLNRGNSGQPRRVAETEKLAVLTTYWGETGNFVPKSAYEQTLQAVSRVALGYFIYDTANSVIQSNSSISQQAITREPTVLTPEIVQIPAN